jgi:hypothetical protein
MAVKAICGDPQQLLDAIKEAIRSGTVETWELDTDGDLTHSPEQWNNEAWFRPSVQTGQLVFMIIGKESEAMSTEVYAVYHGRFIEMLLAHFDDKFSSASATAQAIVGEYVAP